MTTTASVSVPRVQSPRAESWLIRFALFGFACQLILLVPGVGGARAVVRSAAFLSSVALLLLPAGANRRIAPRAWATCVLGILVLGFAHPDSNLLGALVQFALYLAILGPIYWVPRLRVTPVILQRLLLVLWAFYTASAALGALQAYFPGHFQPSLSTVISGMSRDRLDSLKIQLVTGEHIFRPMGLTDTPGGAAYGACYAVLLSLGILQSGKVFPGARVCAWGSIVLGLVCLYLCQVRSVIVVLGVCIVTLAVLAAVRGQMSRLLITAGALAVALPLAFGLAFALGGRVVTDRLNSLVATDASSVYYKNRGRFLEGTIDRLLPKYPLGAGLGRWGMSYQYFGSRADALWVEIQWTGWLFDGGVPMILAYVTLIGVSSWHCAKVAFAKTKRAKELGIWPSVVLAYNVGGAALCFSYCEFIGASGLEFWLLNAAVLTAGNQLATGDEEAKALLPQSSS